MSPRGAESVTEVVSVGRPQPPERGSHDEPETSWRTPSIGRPLALTLALLAIAVAVAVIVFVVLHRVGGAASGLIVPAPLLEVWCVYRGLLS